MSGVLLILVLFAGTGLVAYAKVWKHRIEKHAALVIIWRWLVGLPWHGGVVSDRGWFRPGTRALTATGHVARRHHRPQWIPASRRCGTVLGLILTVYGYLVNPMATKAGLVLGLAAGLAFVGWSWWRSWKVRKHRKSWLAPLHQTIHHHVSRPVTDRPEDYLHVELDRSAGHIALPVGVSGNPTMKRALEQDVTARLGLETPVFDWRGIAGPEPVVKWQNTSPPPPEVTLDDVRDDIETAKPGQIICGLGTQGQVVDVTLLRQSPHVMIMGPTDSGKSVAMRAFTSQFLHQGGFAIFLDAKWISHAWASSTEGTLPNCVYLRKVEEIHDMFLWLLKEQEKRYKVASAGLKRDGSITSKVGVPLCIVIEEFIELTAALKEHWQDAREKGDPPRSPAIAAVGRLKALGRQARIHILDGSQRAEAKDVGGAAARANTTARLAIGAVDAKSWKLISDAPYPAMGTKPGRGFRISGPTITSFQGIHLTGQEAWDLAQSGEVALAPHDMPYAGTIGAATGQQALEIAGGDMQQAPVAAPTGPFLTLKALTARGVILDSDGRPAVIGNARTIRDRYRNHPVNPFPAVAAYDGQTEMYAEAEVVAWQEARR